MARTLFDRDVVAQVTTDDGDLAPVSATFTVWTAMTGGTQLTDLLAATSTGAQGSAVTVVTPDPTNYRLRFYGPDPYAGALWLQDSSGQRWLANPVDLASRAGGVSTVNGAAGAVTLTADNIGDGASYKTMTAAERTKLASYPADLSGYQTRAEENVANGYAGLDASGKLLTSVLPAASDLSGYALVGDLGIQIEVIATGDDSNLSAALASVPSTKGVNGFIAVKVAGT